MNMHFIYISVLIFLWACEEGGEIRVPEFASISPMVAYEGEVVTIEGQYFSSVAKENVVRIISPVVIREIDIID